MTRATAPSLALLVAVHVLLGCTTSRSRDAAADAGTDDDLAEDAGVADADAGADASGDAGPTQAFVRVAHASPDLAAVDLCVAPHGTAKTQGPLLAELAAMLAGDAVAPDAGAVGVSFGSVSSYVALNPGQYDLTWVAAGSSSCSTARAADAGDAGAFGPRMVTTPALAAGDYATVLLAGDADPSGTDEHLVAAVLRDDAALAGGGAALRTINALPSVPSIDLGMGTAASWLPLLVDVTFAAASKHAAPGDGVVDESGYLPIDPAATTAMLVRPSGMDAGPVTASASNVAIDLGSLVTVLAVGGKTGDPAHPPALMLCVDNAPSGGTLSACSIER